MKIRTRITEMLGVEYPIMMGGIKGVGRAPLAAAVSNAGGFGAITASCFQDARDLKKEIDLMRTLTDKPFGVNISMNPGAGSDYGELTAAYVNVVCEEGLVAVETSGRNPEGLLKQLHNSGVKVIHKVASAKFAAKAASVGVDAVACIGFESGGHTGLDEVAGQIVLERTLQLIDIPVLYAAGVVDGKGLMSALALGAEGVTMGSRFMISKESGVHQKMKEWIVSHKETDTIMVQGSIRNPLRAVKNDMAYRVLGFEQHQPAIEEIMPLINGKRHDEALANGDIDNCLFSCGQAMGLIHDIPTVQEIMDNMIMTAEESYCKLNRMISL